MILRRGTEVIFNPYAQPVPLPTLFLPTELTTIEQDAFSGIAAEAVLIPASVTEIVGDPFEGSTVQVIYIYPDSPAESFAAQWADRYTFIRVDGGD